MWNGDDNHKIGSTSSIVVSAWVVAASPGVRAADLLWIRSAALFSRIGVVLERALQIPLIWQARARERAALASLDDHLLKDIGLTRADTWRESRKPFWTA